MSDCLTEENLQEEYYDETSSLFEQEFSEQDVLPFLLQAQDIISKLESRVVELETDLSVSNNNNNSPYVMSWIQGILI